MATESMHRLSTAASFKEDEVEDHQISVEYESGAKFEGTVINHKRVGKGTFVWPNGSKYEGDYADNQRHGIGICTILILLSNKTFLIKMFIQFFLKIHYKNIQQMFSVIFM